MPDRTNTQTLITLHVSDELLEAAEQCRRGRPRSQWIREAILEKLQREGIAVPEEAALPPDRSGKGGAKKKVVAMPPAQKKVAEDHGSPPESASLPRKKVKYPKKKGR